MLTLSDRDVLEHCCERINRLNVNARPHWGRMTAHQMVCHLSDALRIAAGMKTRMVQKLNPFENTGLSADKRECR